MSSEAKLPLILAVSGHRELRGEDLPAIRESVRKILRELQEQFPHTPLKLMTNLAEGADSLCAELALEAGIPLIAALPLPIDEFRKDFAGEKREAFERLCAAAESVFSVPDTEERPEDAKRSFSYRQGGLYLARHCQILLALWEGNPPKRGGCGVAEVAEFAGREKVPVIRIHCPRREGSDLPAGEIVRLGTAEEFSRLEDFNREAESLEAEVRPDIFPQAYYAAGKLSAKASGKYRTALKLISAAGTALATALLLYDELGLGGMIFVCGALILLLAGLRLYTVQSACHRYYMEYRALAESLRVLSYLRSAGSRVHIGDLFTVYQKAEIAWITKTVCALDAEPRPAEGSDISQRWFQEQRNYHTVAGNQSGRRLKRNNAVIRTACGVSIAIYLFAVAAELFFASPGLRLGICITLGAISAATLFISLYYGRLSVERQSEDHTIMAEFFEEALAEYRENGQTEELLERCAREEIAENANWFAYTAENAPDIRFI